MRVKIVSDGSTTGTQVINIATGESLYGVTGVRWALDAYGTHASATVELTGVEIEAEGELPTQVDFRQLQFDFREPNVIVASDDDFPVRKFRGGW